MGRRNLLGLLATAAALRPLAARAQQKPTPTVGFLSVFSADTAGSRLDAFHQGLAGAPSRF